MSHILQSFPNRTFVLSNGPSVADPAGLIAYAELHKEGFVDQFTDFTDLKKVIADLEYQRAFNDGRMRGAQEVLEAFGLTNEQYGEKLREKNNAQKS